ncbi:MAG: hypothetical protein ACYDC3_17560 [Candidatus Binataceae bacterium]
MQRLKSEEQWHRFLRGIARRSRALLRLEKARRGLDPKRLCFIGMADTANYWWCAQQSLFNNREMEKGFFGAYLYDRINCAFKLGIISGPVRYDAQLLRIAAERSFEEGERQFKQARRAEFLGMTDATRRRSHEADKKLRRDYLAGRIKNETEPEPFEEEEPAHPNKEARLRGKQDEYYLSERYPSFRWHFDWRDYVVVGIPDGITDRFIYEFKSTKVLHYQKPVAEAQADLYGYFFRRKQKRLQFHDIQQGKLLTFSSAISRNNAQRTLRDFAAIEAGKAPIPPKPWKCRTCEFFSVCSVSPSRRTP